MISMLMNPSSPADSATQIVEAIWPLSSVVCRGEVGSKGVLPLRTFIQETLRRSRTSYSTLQVALYYLIRIRPHVPRHSFTTEQPCDQHADRALQCGRRMFLAALILASKYLQDRNYSARAWSKISGLNTHEINQNEIAFLFAVDWKLHVTEDVFQRWTDIVLKCTPSPSPPTSPGGLSVISAQQAFDWKKLILKLDSGLTNIGGLISLSTPRKTSDLCLSSPRSILNAPKGLNCGPPPDHVVATGTTLGPSLAASSLIEPSPAAEYATPGRLAPSLGMLPTPRLTPQLGGFCTPAASAASQLLGKSSAMGSALAQASSASAARYLDRPPTALTASPQSYFAVRRSSLANSASTASSPESMMSDSSRSSRSSSISSASSHVSATLNAKLSAQSRFRGAKQCNERLCVQPSVASVPENDAEFYLTSSPESYSGPVGKFGDPLETPVARDAAELAGTGQGDADSDAARALQDLHARCAVANSPIKAGLKRVRSTDLSDPLQENVRELLRRPCVGPAWPGALPTSAFMHPCLRPPRPALSLQIPVRPALLDTWKRACCSPEAVQGLAGPTTLASSGSSIHVSQGCNGILN